MIIAQVPACNPMTRHTGNPEFIHKTKFVLAHLIWEDCGVDDLSLNLAESELSLVEYSVLRIVTTEEEILIRQTHVWEDDAASSPEMTNAGIVASNLAGRTASGTDNFVVHQREVAFVSFVTGKEEHEETPGERLERERIIYENILRNAGVATPVDESVWGEVSQESPKNR